MKKIISMLSGIIGVILVLTAGVLYLNTKGNSSSNGKVLNIYNWGDYIDPDLITKFEKQTGYKVNYETFDSNEAMYTKVKQGGTSYDIVVPSEYMVQRLRDEHLLYKINHHKLIGLHNIGSDFLNQSFDPHNEYSIPYFWGTLGIIYNDKYVKADQIKTWNSLWNPQFRNKIMFTDGAREFMGIGLGSMGYSLNSTNPKQLTQAYDKLKKLVPNAKAFVSDEIKMYMVNNEAPIAVTFSGEAADMLAENSHLHYVLPKEGSNLWFDNISIPKTCKNKKGAYEFINFMLNPKHAAQNAEYIGYSTPNEAALKLMPKSITEDKQFYPSQAVVKNCQVYRNLGPEYLQKYNDYFLELKMAVN